MQIAGIVIRAVYGGFSNERAMGKTAVLQQPLEGLCADRAFADMLMTVEPGTAWSPGVIHMPHTHRIQSDRVGNLLNGCLVSVVADQIITCHVTVAGIEARTHRDNGAQPFYQCSHLLKAA